jgi:heme-degrading monooxygenase HmoA
LPAKSVNCPVNPRFPRYCAGKEQELRSMFIAMNRFKVRKGAEHDFEQVWLTRDSHLKDVPGFVAFHLLKGPERDDHVLYASHSLWRSEAAFLDWTRSEAFRKAHGGTGANKPLYLGHPEFEGFTVLQEMSAKGRAGAAAG